MEDSYPEEQPTRGRLELKAVITRVDGTVEDLGVISEGWVSLDPGSGGGDE